MTEHPDIFSQLAAPFRLDEVKILSKSGRNMFYITARTVMNRLDEVLGPENWWDRYVPGENSVMCEITIRLPDGSTLTKSDAGGYAGMADQGDDDKSGYSDGFKRTAVKFGVGRHLYGDGVPSFVDMGEGQEYPEPQRPQYQQRQPYQRQPDPQQPRQQGGGGRQTRQGGGFGERPGQRPYDDRQRTNGGNGGRQGNGGSQRQGNGGGQRPQGPPRTGKALYAYIMDAGKQYDVQLLKYVNDWMKNQGIETMIVNLDPQSVAMVLAEVERQLDKLRGGDPVGHDDDPEPSWGGEAPDDHDSGHRYSDEPAY